MTKKEIRSLINKSDWDERTIEAFAQVIDRITKDYLKLDTYPNQFEIVSSEQLLDAYSLIGLPISYNHWKFGKDFIVNQNQYKKGRMGLSYEMVINTNPCISYNLEDNDTCLMTLVYAHVQGHNAFFKNNYMFKQWTQADAIVDYMVFAKNYIAKCEEKYGYEEVELTLDACHALMNYGVDKYKKPVSISAKDEQERLKKKIEDDRVLLNEIWRTIPQKTDRVKVSKFPKQPEENILYFIEKNSPILKEWQRELVRIVRKISQYFYPQAQTKVINEGCLVAGSLINTEDGLIDIKNIVENKYSGRVWDGEKWEYIYDWFTHNNKKTIKIITNKGYEICGGFDHKILVNDEWVKLSNMKIGDKININPIIGHTWPSTNPIIHIPNQLPDRYWTEKEACKLFKLNIGTYRRYNDPNYKFNTLKINVDKCKKVKEFLKNVNMGISKMSSKRVVPNLPYVMSSDLAAWLGYLIGDGNVSLKNRIICLTSGDIDQIERFKILTHNIFGNHIKVKIKKEENKWRAKIHNQIIVEFIHKYLNIKLGKSSSVKEIPELIFRSSKDVVSSFISAYFDCDGCVDKKGICILVSNSKKLVTGVQELLLYFNIFSSFRLQSDQTYHLNICGINSLFFREEIGFNLKRKQERLSVLNNKNFLKRKNECIIEDIIVEYGTTYDFSVSNSHKYYHKGLINHNCATFTHYHIIHKMWEEGYLDEGFMMEFYHHHSNVIYQPSFDSKWYSGINPYTLGFNILMDVKRICENPTAEDKEWFPNLIGKNWIDELNYIIANFKDDSFILQYLSPKVIRDMKLFTIIDKESELEYEVDSIHNERGYKKIRESLSNFYNRSRYIPEIQVYNVDVYGNRTLSLEYTQVDGRYLNVDDSLMNYIKYLWGFPVKVFRRENGKSYVINSIE